LLELRSALSVKWFALLCGEGALQIFELRSAHAVSSRTVSFSVGQSGALALGNVEEGTIAYIHAVDLEAAAVLPRVPHLLIAKPTVAVEGTLFVVRVDVVKVFPTGVVVQFGLHALVRQIVEVGREARFENVALDGDHFAVEKPHEVLSADVENAVSGLVVLVDLHAPGLEQRFDVVLTEESLRYLEAAAAAESSINVVDAHHGVADDVVISAEHFIGEMLYRVDLTRTDLRVVHLDAVAEEQPVHLFDLVAGAKDALVSPVVLQIVAADPLAHFLIQICQRGLEAVARRQVLLKLLSRHQSISE